MLMVVVLRGNTSGVPPQLTPPHDGFGYGQQPALAEISHAMREANQGT